MAKGSGLNGSDSRQFVALKLVANFYGGESAGNLQNTAMELALRGIDPDSVKLEKIALSRRPTVSRLSFAYDGRRIYVQVQVTGIIEGRNSVGTEAIHRVLENIEHFFPNEQSLVLSASPWLIFSKAGPSKNVVNDILQLENLRSPFFVIH